MIVSALREHFPSYEFNYESHYNELEEYAYLNRDLFGDDPDWEQVRESLIAEKDEAFIEPFFLMLNHFRRRLRFFDMAIYGGNGGPLDYDYILTVHPKDSFCYDAPDIGSDMIEDGYGRDLNEQIIAESDMIRGWLDRYPEQYGFRPTIPCDRPKSTKDVVLNLRPMEPARNGWSSYRRPRHG